MPCIANFVVWNTGKEPEQQTLWLPSDFNIVEHKKLHLTVLALSEQSLHQGQACNMILLVQHQVKDIGAIKTDKARNDQEQKQNM